ncbi:hypothetical protein A9K72_08680 [Mesorhizobium loti]|uniref:Uncharacterized protein n=1 Tax=Mesorhizobium jarvisii TaxID=1777867 RepID=A0AA92XCR1_9HYPH|nr:hypothetical protein A9174_25295 [Mesorhizobium loti NZP2037]OBQ68324.1 hypothetical protein A9K72_08680 [Mesorhizobium loti]RJT31021.1 hypothetical protein D3242_22395 [Mesorhizobium jarvisii]
MFKAGLLLVMQCQARDRAFANRARHPDDGQADISWTDSIVLPVARLQLTLRQPALVTRFFLKLSYLPNPAASVRSP